VSGPDDERLLECLTTDALRVADTEPGALATPVPWCGDWHVEDLIGHLGSVQRWATALSAEPGAWFRRREMPAAPSGDEVLSWYSAGLDPMRRAFEGTDLDVTVRTWAGEQPRRWWLRRLAHETTVHRWDVEAATSAAPVPVEVDLAIDGIDELFEWFLPLFADALAGAPATMHLHATDGEGEWLVRVGSDAVEVVHEHAKGDVAVRGPASELLLLLWNRRTPDDVGAEVFGDAALLERWRAAARV